MRCWLEQVVPLLPVILALAGCHTIRPDMPDGTLEGVVHLEWSREDGFIYTPDPSEPLTYTREGKPPLVPRRMFTDGGSIPRVFWSVKGFSPWAYTPAYVLHDWVYLQHRCRDRPGATDTYTFVEANELISDVLDILVVEGRADANGEARRLIRWAVDNFGRQAWNDVCKDEPVRRLRSVPVRLQTFRF